MADSTMRTGTILDALVAGKREELGRTKAHEPLGALRARAEAVALPLPFASCLRGSHVRLIAEIKRASPTKGALAEGFSPTDRACAYADGGAAAISVLTEERRFLGSLEDLARVRAALAAYGDDRPRLLRKDFLFDPYQIYEARAAGADAILLIVAVLDQAALVELLALARSLGLGALIEVHDAAEVERALQAGAEVVGINNRDLRTFVTELAVTERLRALVPAETTLVSESGIHTRADVDRLAAIGVDAILVGEALMRSPSLPATMATLTHSPRGSVLVR